MIIMAIIKKCPNAEKGNCVSEYQDEKYGNGNRVFNLGMKKCACTVCGETISVSTPSKN